MCTDDPAVMKAAKQILDDAFNGKRRFPSHVGLVTESVLIVEAAKMATHIATAFRDPKVQ